MYVIYLFCGLTSLDISVIEFDTDNENKQDDMIEDMQY